MKYGFQHPSFTYDGTGSEVVNSLRRVVALAEELGYDSFWLMDHFHQLPNVGQPKEPMLESWTTQAALSGFTSKIKIGVLVSGVIYRYPSVLAKIGATLDILSKGRLIMGIGAAWHVDEAAAYGISFPVARERLMRLEEAVQIILKMWTEETSSFEGKFYSIRAAYCNPKPIQLPHPPILIGGSGERQTLKIVAKYADACNLFGSPQTIRRRLEILRAHCKNVGREYSSIQKTKLARVIIGKEKKDLEKYLKYIPERERLEQAILGTPEEVSMQVEQFQEAGIESLIAYFEPERELENLQLFAEVMRKF